MSDERDPRVEPRPGDEMEIVPHVFRVARIEFLTVWLEDRHGNQYPIVGVRWADFARNARVVALGEEPA